MKYTIELNGSFKGEIEIRPVGGDDSGGGVITPPIDTAGFKVGVNSFPWFPLRLLKDIGMHWHRCYIASGWIWQPGGLAVQPMHQAETAETHGIDDLLSRAKSMGINTLLCVHQTPEWYLPTGRQDGNNDFAPVKPGLSRTDPASYKDYASFLFQVAARYGRAKVPDMLLKVDTTPRWNGDVLNEKKSGLDLLTYIEPWNEPDKWWKKSTSESAAYFEPEEAAALLSACYDGHDGALGPVCGIKTADPTMQVVMPGITDFDIQYINRMMAWFKANRKDKRFACDILNVHHYSNTGNRPGQYPAQWKASGACLPADDKDFGSVTAIAALAKTLGRTLWVTEFGADKKVPSMMHAHREGTADDQFQAEIIIASIKSYRDAGVDGVFVFTGPDENSGADGGQFETCGVFTSEATGYKPTPASEALRAYLAPKNGAVAAKMNLSKRTR